MSQAALKNETQAPQASEAPASKVRPALRRSLLTQPGQTFITWIASIPTGTPYETVMASDYWRLAAVGQLKIGDEILCRWDDLSLRAELLVVNQNFNTGEVELREISRVQLTAAEHDMASFEDENYRAEYRGMTEKFVIIRKTDGHVMKTGVRERHMAIDVILQELRPHLIGGRN